MEETDAQLVLRVRRADYRAASRLLDRYLRACRAVALAITGTEADAEDICQDSFVIAIERIEDCRDPERFGGWLLQIVRNRARNLVRARALRLVEPLDDSTPSRDPSPAKELEGDELRRRLIVALAALPEQLREIVLLHDLEGWKHQDIADRLEIPSGTVRSHLHHARRKLRELLADVEDHR